MLMKDMLWEGIALGEYRGIGGKTTFRGCRDTPTRHLPTVLLILKAGSEKQRSAPENTPIQSIQCE